LGNCAALSFLQNIQELISDEIGPSNALSDISNISRMEEMGQEDHYPIADNVRRDADELAELSDAFFTSVPASLFSYTYLICVFILDANSSTKTSGILDIFDRLYAQNLLQEWLEHDDDFDVACKAVLFLTFAIGAQARSAGTEDRHRAQYFFRRGREIALLELTDEPRLETVHAFILISLYLLASSKRNAAHLNLGIAISAAKSLGIHQLKMSDEYQDTEGRSR
jgi:hypothetical protein